MDSFEINKIVGAVLAALLVIVGMRVFMEIKEDPHEGDTAHASTVGYLLPAPAPAAKSAKLAAATPGAPATPGAVAATPAAPAGFDPAKVVALVGKADANAGKKIFKKCKACHSTNKGGANKVGPNLWNVVGREKADNAAFKYSSALKSKGGKWTLGDVVAFLHKPKDFIKGTKMSFAGLKKDVDLANITAYLRSLSDSPVPLAQ